MKYIFIFLISVCSQWVSGQNLISPITINLPANPPANTAEWATTLPPVMILAQTKLVNGQINGMVQESKILVTIKSGGNKVCGTHTPQSAPISGFTTANKNWTGANVLNLLGQDCTLKPGNYELCVQFYSFDRRILGENCKPFTIEDKKQVAENYSPPQNIYPDNEKQFKEAELKSAIIFRWTPLVPKPKEQVTYRLKVWQLMQGQNGINAMKANTPIVEKEVANITQAVVTNLYTGPCKPPYLCNYVWQVQAVNKDGKPMGSNEGKSELWSFKVQNNIDIQIDSLKVGCCIDGKQSIYLKVKNNLATAVNIVAVKYKVNGVGVSINLTPITPTLVQTIAGNGSVVFTSSINCIDAINFLKFLVDAEQVADPDNKETEVKSDTLKCRCDACDEKNFSLTAPAPSQINFSNNVLAFTQAITVGSTKPVKSIKAELVYFEMIPENDYCIPCNKDAITYGHFTNGTNSMQWNTVNPPLNFTITTPQMTPCCSAVFKWCIRYKIEFKDCTTCNKLVCYEKKKEGCDKANNQTK